MSSLSVLSPLLRRGAATRWTCRTCLGLGPQAQRSFASRVDAADFTIRPGEKNKSRSSGSGNGNGNGNNSGRSSKRRSRLLVAGGVVAVGAVAVATNDDAKHAWTAAQRSYRVLSTLVLNIRE
jgi:aarF domain-containing kinase